MRELTAAETARFWSKVDRTDRHWLWTAGTREGYGRFGYGRKGDYHIEDAHRIAYRLTYGPIPAGLLVLHRCDIRLCCFPPDLFLGSHADNQADKAVKNRSHLSRLSIADVAAIRAADGSYAEIARRFGLHRSTVRRIKLRINRRFLP